jgi:hypothetical protein
MRFGIVLSRHMENITLLDLDRVCTGRVVLDGRPVQLRVFGISLCAIRSLGLTQNLTCRTALPEDNSGSAIVKMRLSIDDVTGNLCFPRGGGASQGIGFRDLE